MKSLKKYSASIVVVTLLSVLTTVALVVSFYYRNSAPASNQAETAELQSPQTESGEFEGNQAERKKWFIQQRTYGLGEIPADARKNAKETADLIAPALQDSLAPANTWTLIGPQPTHSTFFTNAFGDSSGRINEIAVHPTTPNTVLVGAATGGIWRSTNALADANGPNPPVFSAVSDAQVDLAVGSIAFAPSNPTIVYAGMGDIDNRYLGTGVLKSTDTGATWSRVDVGGIPPRSVTSKIAVSLNNPNTVFLARVEYFGQRGPDAAGGFYRSTDGGSNWTRTFAGSVSSIATHPTNPNVIYIAVISSFFDDPSPARGIYRSVDGGQTFAMINGNVDFSTTNLLLLATTPANPQKIYAYGGTPNAPFVLGGVNDGVNPVVWTQNPLPGNQFDSAQFDYNAYIAADPTDDGRLYVGSRDIYRVILNPGPNNLVSIQNLSNSFTFNAGANRWDYTLNGSKVHADQQSFAFAGNSNTFFAGSDGGINRTTDGGATFTKNLNRSLGLTQSIGVSIHPTDANIAYTGTQDNGTQRRENGTQWREFSNGDGGHAVINPLDPTMVFTSYVMGSFTRHVENGTLFSANINSNFAGMRVNFYPPFVGNGTDATLYTGTQTLTVCTDCATSAGQGTWTYPAGQMTDLTRGGFDTINAVGVQKAAFGNSQVIYVGSNNGAFQVSQNGGATFTNRTTQMDNAVHNNTPPANPGRTITNIRVDPTNAGTAYITVSGFGTRHLFRSTNFGANITPLPFTVDVPANDFIIHPTIPTTFYLATDIGVFRSTDSGATWNQFNSGMPPVVVTRFDSTPDGRIAAATYGRGIYMLSAATPPRAPYDFDGEGKTDIGIFRPNGANSAEWWVQRSSNSTVLALGFGLSTDKPVPGDYTGDGKADVAVFRPASGQWFIMRSEDFSFYGFPFGVSTDVPVPADFDGDGRTDPAVFRPSTQTWFISRSTGGTTIKTFGTAADVPVVADYDGDGKADIAIFRPSLGQWWIERSSNGTVVAFQFGVSTDKPVQGDYTGDGRADVAIFRPSNGNWFVLRSEDSSFYAVPFGTASDIPAPGDYDGDGRFDTTVFRPSNSTWFSNRSTAGISILAFGANGDRPVASSYIP